MLPPFIIPYVVGVVTAPLVGKIIKPLARGVVKTTVGVALQVRKLAVEAGEDLQDFAAEVSADFAASEVGMQSGATVSNPSSAGARPGATVAGPSKKL